MDANSYDYEIIMVDDGSTDASWNIVKELSAKNPAIRGISSFSGQIRISKDMSTAQLNAIRRATKEFLGAKTSKLTGIRQAKSNVMNSLKTSLSRDDLELSDREVQALYKVVEDKETRSTADKIGASTLWNLMIDAKEKGTNQRDFLMQVKDYYNYSNDMDVKNDLRRIYNDYIK